MAERTRAPTPRTATSTAPSSVFWVPQEARWRSPGAGQAADIGKLIDDAMVAIERDNPPLKGVLPKDYARPGLDKQRLGELIDLIGTIGLGDRGEPRARTSSAGSTNTSSASSPAPRARRAASSTRRARVVRCSSRCSSRTRAASTTPAAARAACSCSREKFVEAHGGRPATSRIFGQESNPTTWRLGKMNLAIRGIEATSDRTTATVPPRPAQGPQGRLHPRQPAVQRQRLGRRPAPRGRRAGSTARRRPATPTSPGCSTSSTTWRRPASPASCWPTARCRRTQSGEGEIRKAIVEADLVDCMVALPGQLFYSTQIPVCLWFLARDKKNGRFRDRRGETLFIDARRLGRHGWTASIAYSTRGHRQIAGIYHAWRGDEGRRGVCRRTGILQVGNNRRHSAQ